MSALLVHLKLANLPAIITESQLRTDPCKFWTSKFTVSKTCYDRKTAVYLYQSFLNLNPQSSRKEGKFAQQHFKRHTQITTKMYCSLPLNCSVFYDHEDCQKNPKVTRVKSEQQTSKRLHPNISHSSQLQLKREGTNSVFHIPREVTLLAYMCQKGTQY